MIIRSQDRMVVSNFEKECGIYIIHKEKECRVETDRFILGRYSTEEKALKVLDMITEAYQKETYGKFEYNADVVYCVPRNTVFQMPRDSEV